MKKNNAESGERTSGDLLIFFALHNLISVLFFFLFTYFLGVYAGREDLYDFSWIQVIGYLISSEFWKLTILQVFPLSVLSSIMGRITAYYSIRFYTRYRDRKTKTRRTMKKWSELNRGINRIGIKYFLNALISSFIYSIGIISLLSQVVFNETALLPLLIIYGATKLGVFLFVRWFVSSRM